MANNVQYVVLDQRKPSVQRTTPNTPPRRVHSQQQQQPHQPAASKAVRVIPRNAVNASSTPIATQPPKQIMQRTVPADSTPRMSFDHRRSREPQQPVKTIKMSPQKALAQNTALRRPVPSSNTISEIGTREKVKRKQEQKFSINFGSSEEDIETEVIDSSMVEVQMEKSNSPQPFKRVKTVAGPKSVVQAKQAAAAAAAVAAASSTLSSEAAGTTSATDDELKCDLCHKEFHSARQRQRHRITHLETKMHNCRKCDKPFLKKVDLLAHEKTHLSGGGGGPCKSEPNSGTTGGLGIKRKTEDVDDDDLLEMAVTEEEVIHDTSENMYVQEV